MVYYKTSQEIELIRQSCELVSKTLALVASEIKPGISGAEIDQKAEAFIRDHKGIPGFKGYQDFPATLCISINDAVVHGIPSKEPFKNGDIVSVDCGVYMNEFFGDSAFTFALGDVDPEVIKLLKVTRESLNLAIESAKVGGRLGDIGFAVQDFCERQHKYGVVREMVGHGIGRDLHEEPQVPNTGRRGAGPKLKEGLVIAIEPMVNLGTRKIKTAKDGWTILTADNQPSAHYEHTIAVLKSGTERLSNHKFVETEIEKNDDIIEI